jgi:hypothetical protein
MARKPTETATGTITTRIGVLGGGEVVALESVGREMFLTVNGVQIARRVLHPKLKVRKTWIPTKQGWFVIDTNGTLSLQIKHNGKLLEWSSTQTPVA